MLITWDNRVIKAPKLEGKPVPFTELAKAVEALGYKSKNTAQVLRLVAGKGKKFVVEGDLDALSG